MKSYPAVCEYRDMKTGYCGIKVSDSLVEAKSFADTLVRNGVVRQLSLGPDPKLTDKRGVAHVWEL